MMIGGGRLWKMRIGGGRLRLDEERRWWALVDVDRWLGYGR